MKLDKNQTRLAMARACMAREDIAKNSTVPLQTVNRAINGYNVRPATAGKIARALGVDILDILEVTE